MAQLRSAYEVHEKGALAEGSSIPTFTLSPLQELLNIVLTYGARLSTLRDTKTILDRQRKSISPGTSRALKNR